MFTRIDSWWRMLWEIGLVAPFHALTRADVCSTLVSSGLRA